MCCVLSNLVKYTLFITNIFFILAGLVLVGIGTAVLVNLSDALEVIPVNINAIPISVIVLGCVVVVISFCGCCGAIRESTCLLMTYAVCVGVLAGGKIYLTVVIFRALSNIQETVQRWLTDAFHAANNQPFRLLEVAFQCCGTTGPTSYLSALPVSCCRNLPQDATQCPMQDAFSDGCVDRLGSYLETFGDAIGGILIVIIVFELVAVVFSLWLIIYNRNKARRSQY